MKTAVLFLVFNRPDVTKKVFDTIRAARPSRLYVSADGARTGKDGEPERCEEVRKIVTEVDWPCEVKTLFRDENYGCKRAVSEGISWFFENEEEGIVLEDDCVADPSFFVFCEELLERYRHDKRISLISGINFQFGRRRNDDSYYFSKYTHIWGWATWRDRWVNSYDVTISKWPRIRDEGWLDDMVGDKQEVIFWKKIFERVYKGEIDTWDYQWVLANWIEGRMSIIPSVNLVSNIGFNGDATHTKAESEFSDMECVSIQFPLKHPELMIKNRMADEFSERTCFRVPFIRRVRNRLAWIMRRK